MAQRLKFSPSDPVCDTREWHQFTHHAAQLAMFRTNIYLWVLAPLSQQSSGCAPG